jgi:ribosomal protein L11 methyltransferase
MREIVLTVPRAAVEEVLDRLLPVIPGGVREVPHGHHVELRIRGADLPAKAELKAAVGRWPHKLSECAVSDDWRERRLADYEAEVIAGRLVVRPDWAPVAAPGVIDIALGESAAFGVGAHPTTRVCLELLLEFEPRGSFADLGCGTGVLAIVAARLGWAPVTAVDVRAESVAAARANAARNGVAVQVQEIDLTTRPAPRADGFAANVPVELHEVLARSWEDPLSHFGIVSGFGPDEVARVADAYAARGLRESVRVQRDGWVIALLRRD